VKKRIRFTPSATGPHADQIVNHRVSLEIDGAPQGGEVVIPRGETGDFGHIDLAEGKHTAVFRIYNVKANGSANKQPFVETDEIEVADTSEPDPAEAGQMVVEDEPADAADATGAEAQVPDLSTPRSVKRR
jgi:hypothetical protein